jgi:hypothetical protein
MTDIDLSALDRELKKGAAELLLLSVLEARPRHGYELGKLIETQSGGRTPAVVATCRQTRDRVTSNASIVIP